MKKIVITLVLTILLLPAGSYALVDGILQGGYTFNGELKTNDKNYGDVNGIDLAIMGHFNLNLEIFMFGAGPVFKTGSFTYKSDTGTDDFKIKSSYGTDFIFMFKIHKFCPSFRFGFSFVDNLVYDFNEYHKDKKRFLNTGWWALGLGYQVMDYLIIRGEYERCGTNLNQHDTLVRNVVNVGAMILY